jgi:hypothetical protein
MEGHFIRGYGDSQKPQAEIELLPGAAAPATNAEETIARIHAWNPRKQQVFRPEHIRRIFPVPTGGILALIC